MSKDLDEHFVKPDRPLFQNETPFHLQKTSRGRKSKYVLLKNLGEPEFEHGIRKKTPRYSERQTTVTAVGIREIERNSPNKGGREFFSKTDNSFFCPNLWHKFKYFVSKKISRALHSVRPGKVSSKILKAQLKKARRSMLLSYFLIPRLQLHKARNKSCKKNSPIIPKKKPKKSFFHPPVQSPCRIVTEQVSLPETVWESRGRFKLFEI